MSLTYTKNIVPIILSFLVSFLPISLLSGSLIINTFHVLIAILFLFEILNKKKLIFLHNKFFYLLIFFWISLIVNLIFSSDPESGFLRSIGFIRIILLVFAIKYIFSYEEYKYKNYILKTWFVIFIIVSIDLVFEFIFGKNILGFETYMPGRLAGFLDDELKIGGYYFGFVLLSLSFIHCLKKKNYLLVPLLILIFLIISFVIGERSNFIKVFLIISLFTLLIYKKNFFKLFILFLCSILIFIGIILSNENLKYRYYTQLKNKNINEIYYFQHYNSGLIVFKENPIFGVGIKNFRNEILKDKYINKKYWNNRHIKSTHPHQINFEILAETGIFGFVCYILFFFFSLFKSINGFIKNKNLLLLSSIVFIVVSLNPILPSGSFFTTFSATIFWINYAIMITFFDYKKDQLKN